MPDGHLSLPGGASGGPTPVASMAFLTQGADYVAGWLYAAEAESLPDGKRPELGYLPLEVGDVVTMLYAGEEGKGHDGNLAEDYVWVYKRPRGLPPGWVPAVPSRFEGWVPASVLCPMFSMGGAEDSEEVEETPSFGDVRGWEEEKEAEEVEEEKEEAEKEKEKAEKAEEKEAKKEEVEKLGEDMGLFGLGSETF